MSSRSDCPSDQVLQNLLASGSPDEQSIEFHLRDCATCQQRLSQFSDSNVLSDARRELKRKHNEYPFLESAVRAGDLGVIAGLNIEQEIGRGGNGIVFRAFDSELQRQVAVKVLLDISSRRSEARFNRESHIAAQLKHDNLVNVYSVGRTRDDRPFLVMPLINGTTLKELVVETMAASNAANLVRQVADGLQAIHSAGLIHRDVKPANILIDSHDRRPKLTDFGLARAQASSTLTQADILSGTPEYMSPEQSAGSSELGPSSDIYSLGITLYQCLTGVTPFQGRPIQVLQQHRETEPLPVRSLRHGCPQDLDTICMKAISKSPADRYASASAMSADLERFLGNRPVLARPVSATRKLQLWAQRNRALAVSLSLLAASLIAGSVVSTVMWFRSDQNARLAGERAENLKVAEFEQRAAADGLAARNDQMQEMLDFFFARVLSDEDAGMQISVQFRNEMVGRMMAYYDGILDTGTRGRERAIRAAEQTNQVIEYLQRQNLVRQTYELAHWNWNRVKPIAMDENAQARELNVAARCALKCFEMANTLTDVFFKGEETTDASKMLAYADELVQRSKELGDDLETSLVGAMVRHEQLKLSFAENPKESKEQLSELFSSLTLLSQQHASANANAKANSTESPNSAASELCHLQYWVLRTLAQRSPPLEAAEYRESIIEIFEVQIERESAEGEVSVRTRRYVPLNRVYQAKALISGDRPKEAVRSLDTAIQEFEELIANYVAYANLRLDLAETFVVAADVHWEEKQLRTSLEHLEQAIEQFENVLASDANQSRTIRRLTSVLKTYAERKLELGEKDIAFDTLEKAVVVNRKLFDLPKQYRLPIDYHKFKSLLQQVIKFSRTLGLIELADLYEQESDQFERQNTKVFAPKLDG